MASAKETAGAANKTASNFRAQNYVRNQSSIIKQFEKSLMIHGSEFFSRFHETFLAQYNTRKADIF